MANRRQPYNNRRSDFGRNDRPKAFVRPGVSPWQGAAPTAGIASLLPIAQGSTEATLALANNLINNLLQTRQAPVPSLLDMPIRRQFAPEPMRFDRGGGGYSNQRMGNQGNFRRQWNNNRSGDRNNFNHGSFRPRDGPRQPYRNYQRKDDDSKSRANKKSDEKKDEAKTDPDPKQDKPEKSKQDATKTDEAKKASTGRLLKSRYDDINPCFLKCHICNNVMWDGRSFENHVNGVAHSIMMQKAAESYALTADTIRQEIKIREMKRTRKALRPAPRDFYCAMCDMYASDGVQHRTTIGHRKLKKYLHPACTVCKKEMPTRIEFDEHRLSPEHLRRLNPHDLDKDKTTVVYSYHQELMNLMYGSTRYKRNHLDLDAEDSDQPKEPIKVETTDLENTVLDYKEGDDVTVITKEMLPNYSTERGLGRSFLGPYTCVQCKLCNKLLESDETAEVHIKTKRHYQLFVKLLQDKSGCMPLSKTAKKLKSKAAKKAAANKTAEGTTTATSAAAIVKRELNDEDEEVEESADWKRRRTNEKDDVKLEHDDVEMGDGQRSPVGTGVAAAAADESWELPADEEVENWDVPATNGATEEAKNGDDEEMEATPVEAPAVKEEEVSEPQVAEEASDKSGKDSPAKASPGKPSSNRVW